MSGTKQGDIHMRVLECLLPYLENLYQYPMCIYPWCPSKLMGRQVSVEKIGEKVAGIVLGHLQVERVQEMFPI